MTPTPPSYGDVTGEYLAMRTNAGIVGGAHEIVWVRGPDAVTFLEGLLSQAIESMAVGSVARSLLLSPQGKLRATTWVLRGEAEIGIVVDAGRGSVVVDDLTRFKIRVDAAVESETGLVADVVGPGAGAAVSRGNETELDGDRWVRWENGTVVAPLPFSLVALPRFVVASPVGGTEFGLRPVGRLAHEAVRIEAGEPVMGIDVDESTIPQEAGVVDGAVDFTKGCYLGQELVARIDSRGHVNRHMRGLVVRDNVLPPLGAVLTDAGGAEVGKITSLAESLELRAPVALGLIRREVSPEETVTVRWDGGVSSAVVRELPLDEFGPQ